MTTAWSHLPNAAHIDRVLASVKAHHQVWAAAAQAAGYAAWDAAWNAAHDAAWGAAHGEAHDAAREAALDAAWKSAGPAAWRAARGAIAALIAWDDSSKYLDLPCDQLRVWHALSEHPACLLLIPAVIAFEKINERSNSEYSSITHFEG